MTDGRPLLQGPMNPSLPSAIGLKAKATSLHVSFKLGFFPDTGIPSAQVLPPASPSPSCTSIVAVGTSDGKIFIHVGHGLLGPIWSEESQKGQCVIDVKGMRVENKYNEQQRWLALIYCTDQPRDLS